MIKQRTTVRLIAENISSFVRFEVLTTYHLYNTAVVIRAERGRAQVRFGNGDKLWFDLDALIEA